MEKDAQIRELFDLAKRISKTGEFVGMDTFIGRDGNNRYKIEYQSSPGYDHISIYGPGGFLSSLNRNMWGKIGRDEYTVNGEVSPEELRGLLENLEKDEEALKKIREDYFRSFTRRSVKRIKGARLGSGMNRKERLDNSDLLKRAFGASALGYLFFGPFGLIFGPALIKKERRD